MHCPKRISTSNPSQKGGAGPGAIFTMIGVAVAGGIVGFTVLNAGQSAAQQGNQVVHSVLTQGKAASPLLSNVSESDNMTGEISKIIENIESTANSSSTDTTGYDGMAHPSEHPKPK